MSASEVLSRVGNRAWGHLLIALVVTAPGVLSPFSQLIGNESADVWNHAWGPWWWWHSLGNGQLPWQTDLLHWPAGGTLWFIDPVLALLGSIWVGLIGLAGAYNLVLVLYVAFASWAARVLALALGAGRWASWVASAGFAASAWMACELHNGISEACNIGAVALALAWTERAVQSESYRSWALAGLGVGLATICSPYLGLGAGLMVLVRALGSWRRAWLAGLVASLVGAPGVFLLRLQLLADDAIIKHPGSMNDQLALHNAVDPRTFVYPFGFRSIDLSHEGFEHSMYLGLIALALAGLALWRLRPRSWRQALRSAPLLWSLAAVCGVIFALGPYLTWEGEWVTLANGARIRLPWWGLQKIYSGLAVTHPLRLGVPTLAIVSALAAVGAGQLIAGPRVLVIAGLVAFDGLVISGAAWPVATSPFVPTAVHEEIARAAGDPIEWGVLDLPTEVGHTMKTSRYLVWQSVHGWGIPYAPDARSSTCSLVNEGTFKRFIKLSNGREDDRQRLGLERLGGTGAVVNLRRRKIRWVVVHHDLDADAAEKLSAAIASELGPGTTLDSATYWDLEATR